MKRFILPLAAALLLTGCTAGSPAAAPSAPAESHAVQVAATPEPSATPSVDVKQAKADALAAGRPEAAWDKNCVAWEMPKADTKGQEWANKLGQEWLESNEAGCPDATVLPGYFVNSWSSNSEGILNLSVDDAIKAADNTDSSTSWKTSIGINMFCALGGAHSDLKEITVTTSDGSQTSTITRADFESLPDYGDTDSSC